MSNNLEAPMTEEEMDDLMIREIMERVLDEMFVLVPVEEQETDK